MSKDDRIYFLRRAEAELDLARAATHERAARAHFLIAGVYFDRVYGAMPAVTAGRAAASA